MRQIVFRSLCLVVMVVFAVSPGNAQTKLSDPNELAPEASILELVTSVEVGGIPEMIVVDHAGGRNDVAFYDHGSSNLKFMDADSMVIHDELHIATWAWIGWMQYDRYFHRIFFVSTRSQYNPAYWEEARIHVIENHVEIIPALSVNKSYNYGLTNPPDHYYKLHGVVLEQPYTEGSNPARLILDNNLNGMVDVVDLNPTGDGIALKQRASYRAPLGDPPWNNHAGTSLALETNHETLGVDDLATTDILYNSDANYTKGHLHVMRINHPLQPLGAVNLPDVDFSGTQPFGNPQSDIQMAAPRDRLYIANPVQWFENGYLGKLNTTNNTFNAISFIYGDAGIVHVDWYDTNRMFVTTCDGFSYDPLKGRYLRFLYNDIVVDSLKLVDNCYESNNEVRDMVFDPYVRKLYLTMGTKIWVIRVNYGAFAPYDGLTPRLWFPVVIH